MMKMTDILDPRGRGSFGEAYRGCAGAKKSVSGNGNKVFSFFPFSHIFSHSF